MPTKVDACKRGKSPVKKPVSVTDKRPSSVAVPETSALSQLVEVTLHCMLAVLAQVKPPLIVSVPLGAHVPSTVVPLVVLTVPLPVNVPDLYTWALAAVIVPPLVTVKTPVPPPAFVVPPT